MNTKALLVGIARYKDPRNNLLGVDNDMEAINRVMGKFGIWDTQVLRDANATAANVQTALNSLVAGAKPGDVRVFYFSGHGVLLEPGFAGSDDPDGRDEAFVTYDGSLSTVITDTWMAAYLRSVLPRGVHFWGIYDCCHSGDLYKALTLEISEDSDSAERSKSLEFHELLIDAPPSHAFFGPSSITTKNLVLDGSLETSVHFGASEPERSALCKTIDGVACSVFTYALEKVIAPGQSVATFEQEVTSAVAALTRVHTPQIACPPSFRHRELFT